MADRPKRPWKELDALRDGRRTAPPPRAEAADAKASKAHRAALDALFAKGEVGKYAEKLGLGATPGKPAAPEEPKAVPAPPKPDPEAVARAEKDAEKQLLRKKLLESTGKDAIGRAFDKLVKACGMPSDWEVLERGLEHPNDDRLAEVMAAIETQLGRDKPRRVRTLDGRLRFIAETHDDRELRARAEALRGRL